VISHIFGNRFFFPSPISLSALNLTVDGSLCLVVEMVLLDFWDTICPGSFLTHSKELCALLLEFISSIRWNVGLFDPLTK